MNKKVESLLNTINKEKLPNRVLDVGGDSCDIALYFANQGSDVDVIEPKPRDDCRNKNINLIENKIEDISLPKNEYDLIIMRSVIHFIPPKILFSNVLPKVEKSLSKNGLLYIFTMTPPEESPRFTHYPKYISSSFNFLELVNKKEHKKNINGREHISWDLVYKN